ncbi:MAG: TonB family protein [Rhodocyclaceae bacterium]
MARSEAPGAGRFAGLVIVTLLHGMALYGLWSHRVLVVPDEMVTLFVDTVALPPLPPKELPQPTRLEKPKPVKRPRPAEKPGPQQLVSEAPVVTPAETVAPPPPQVDIPPSRPVGPVTLSSELAVSCPERGAPVYPPISRRLGEEGKVVLRVELDEQGRVSSARVSTASGFSRLDAAALAAVKAWRCTPARRDGQPVRAVALQPFRFVLQ